MSNEWVEAEEEMAEEYAAPRKPFVRLTDEEIGDIEASVPPKMELNAAKKLFADRIQDALEEKNR